MSETVASLPQMADMLSLYMKHEPDRVKALFMLSHVAHFNLYRLIYPELSFQDKQRIYERYQDLFPQERVYYDSGFVKECVKRTGVEVVHELGGYNGGLAYAVLKEHPHVTWINYELNKHDIMVPLATSDFNYSEIVLNEELWKSSFTLNGGMFLSVHAIEHFSDKEVYDLIDYLKKCRIHYLLFQIPLQPDGQTWMNYYGAHVLNMGSKEFVEQLKPEYRLIAEVPKGKGMKDGWCCLFENQTRRMPKMQ